MDASIAQESVGRVVPFSGLGGQLPGDGRAYELVEGYVFEVVEDGLLALFPGFVRGAGGTGAAGTFLHDAARNAEGAFGGFDGVAQRYFGRGPREPGAPTAALLALDQPLAGEVRQDTGQRTARDAGLGRDPVRRHPLPEPRQVKQRPQGVPPLAAQLQPQTSSSRSGPPVATHFLPVPHPAHRTRRTRRRTRKTLLVL